MPLTSFGHSAQYQYLDQALRSRWQPWKALENDMRAFVAQPKEAYLPQIAAEVERLRILNPTDSLDELRKFVEEQFAVGTSDWWQFHEKFDERHMNEFVTVVLLAHALTEALSNAILAIGLANAGSQDLFPTLERAGFTEKWITAPKAFAPTYEFPRGTGLHETLVVLARQRNALVHSKIELTVDNQRLLSGFNVKRQGYEEEGRWIRRFFNLPYDLVEFARRALPGVPIMLLFGRTPIERDSKHGA